MSDDDSLSLPRHIGPYTLTEQGVEWRLNEPPMRWKDIARFSIVGDFLKGRGIALHSSDEAAFEGGFGVPDTKAPKPRVVLYTRGTGQTPEGLMLQLERWRDHHGAAKSAAAPKKHPPPPPPKPDISLPPKPEVPPQTAVWEPEPQAVQEPTRLHPSKEKRGASNTNKRVVTQVSRSYSSTSVNIRNGRIMEMVAVKVDSPQEPVAPLAPEEEPDVNMAGPMLFIAAVALAGAVFFESYKKGLLTFLCMALFISMCVAAYGQYRHRTKNIPFRYKMLIFFAAGAAWNLIWNVAGHPWVARPGAIFMMFCGPLFFIAFLSNPPRR